MRYLVVFCSIIFVAGVICFPACPACADLPTYGLRLHKISDNRTDVSVYDTKTRRVVWTKKFTRIEDNSLISWSADHRAVAIVDASDATALRYGWRIVIWSAQRKVQTIPRIPLSAHVRRVSPTIFKRDLLEASAFLDVALSPDKKRLLVHVSYNQGMGSLDQGELWCLTLRSLRVQQITDNAEGDSYWSGPYDVHFVHVTEVDGPDGLPIRTVRTKATKRVL